MYVSARFVAVTFAALVAIPMGFLPVGSAAPDGPAARPMDYILRFQAMPDDRSSYGGEPVVAENAAIQVLVVRAGDAQALERRAARDPRIVSIEKDLEAMHALLVPGDPLYAAYQYDLKPATTGMEAAWDITKGSTAVKACVVDTGQYRAHQGFTGVAWGEWKDFVAGKATAYDDNGHGTHVTGTIGATIDDGRGTAGIAQVTLAGAKVLNRQGSGTYSAVANGITWCADIGADVINLSLGGSYSATVAAAVAYADRAGALVVAAAGNSGPCSDCVGYPARQAEALAVACTDAANLQCSFSSAGPEVDIAAPGKSIVSTYPAGIQPCTRKNTSCHVQLSGTSMSAPHVAGLAALVKSAHPEASNSDIRARILGTAVDLGAPGPDPVYGVGLMQGTAVS